jgi:Tol biopolymer transport system component
MWIWDPTTPPAHSDAPLASGRIVYAHESTGRILSVLANGSEAHVLTGSSEALHADPSPSPDGRTVVFTRRDGSGRSDIAVVNADGTSLRILDPTPDADERTPAFGPAGDRIYFARDVAPGSSEIFAYNLRNRAVTQLTHADQGVVSRPAASPDGTLVAFDARGGTAIYVARTDGGNLVCLSDALDSVGAGPAAKDSSPAFSPDSAWIAFASTRSGASEVWVARADGTGARRVTELGDCHDPSWSPDGSALCFERSGEVWAVRADGTRAVRVVAAARATSPNWAPDPGVTLPLVRGVARSASEGRFRLKITGESFQPGLQVYVGEDAEPLEGVRFKGENTIVVSGNGALEARFARGSETTVRIVNPDGGEVTVPFTR